MKKPLFLYLSSVIVAVLFIGFFLIRSVTLSKEGYLNAFQIRPDEMVFQTAQPTWWGNGLILSDVQIPSWHVPHTIKKVILRKTNNSFSIHFSGISFDVTEALRQKSAEELLNALTTNVPYRDVFKYPLENLALNGTEIVRADIVATVTPKNIILSVSMPKMGKILLEGEVPSSLFKNPRLWSETAISKAHLTVVDQGGFKTYHQYAAANGYAKPKMPVIIDLTQPVFIRDFLR